MTLSDLLQCRNIVRDNGGITNHLDVGWESVPCKCTILNTTGEERGGERTGEEEKRGEQGRERGKENQTESRGIGTRRNDNYKKKPQEKRPEKRNDTEQQSFFKNIGNEEYEIGRNTGYLTHPDKNSTENRLWALLGRSWEAFGDSWGGLGVSGEV